MVRLSTDQSAWPARGDTEKLDSPERTSTASVKVNMSRPVDLSRSAWTGYWYGDYDNFACAVLRIMNFRVRVFTSGIECASASVGDWLFITFVETRSSTLAKGWLSYRSILSTLSVDQSRLQHVEWTGDEKSSCSAPIFCGFNTSESNCLAVPRCWGKRWSKFDRCYRRLWEGFWKLTREKTLSSISGLKIADVSVCPGN